MKASELIKKLQKQIEKHGDCEIYTIYDMSSYGCGCLRNPVTTHYYKKAEKNYYADYSDYVENIIIIE